MLHPIYKILRLYRRQHFLQNNYFNHVRTITDTIDISKHVKPVRNKDFKSLLQDNKDKITFSSYLEHEKLEVGYYKYHLNTVMRAKQQQDKEFKEKSLPPLPVSLQYLVDKDKLLQEDSCEPDLDHDNEFQLPYGTTTRVEYQENEEKPPVHTERKVDSEFDRSNLKKWMTNYEYFDDTKHVSEEDDDIIEGDWAQNYGTPDPSVPISHVPCGGCGALLHCSDHAIPGYLPSEIFRNRKIEELKTMECQRCHFLTEYNIALDVSVEPEEYEKLLQFIRNVRSMVLLMVDLLDFPCSIWPGIVDVIGTERPLIIVANKVDLLPGDSIGYLKRIKESLLTEINKTKLGEANIKHVALISAKTGYGVEDLISALFKLWLYKGDVFLVGCTNVGKSSLFNALLQSDYCKVHAVDIVKRATVSRWPGTTLNLLKFPINRLSGWKIHTRTKRLMTESKLMQVEKEIRNAQLEGRHNAEPPALIGHIGRSFSELNVDDDRLIAEKHKNMVLDERDKIFAKSKWCYDTPGVVHPDQVLSLLSTEELLIAVPKKLIRPQTYYLYKGSTIFIGGLARIDHVYSTEPCRFTIFCSESLPITVTKTEDADEIYDKFVGTELFAAPTGGVERMNSWPGLQKKEELLEFVGEGPKICCGDVVLSSVAWVSVTAKQGSVCKVRAWTPQGRGIYKRCPSLLPFAINRKGKRLRDTPAYRMGKVYSDERA